MQRPVTAPSRFDARARGRLRDQRGMGLLAILVALLIAAALYLGYLRLADGGGERAVGVRAIDAGRAVACRVQRQELERDLVAWAVSHPDDVPSLSALDADGLRVPSCPEGGRYNLVGQSVTCSVHP